MRLAFLGTPGISVPSLHALLDAGHEILLVVTQPDRPAGRSGRPVPPEVKTVALERGLPLDQPQKIRTAAFLERIAQARPDALVVVAYGRILPEPVLTCARLGAINLHFSLLPSGRGAAPVQWTLARCEEVAGVTTMQISAKLDEGDVLLRREVPIEQDEHCPQLQSRLATLGAQLLVETLVRLERGDLEPQPQDHARATYAPPLRKEDGQADFELTAREVEGRVRGFDPWPGVWAVHSGRRLRIVRAGASPAARSAAPAGTVLGFERDALLLACGGASVLEVRAVQLEGGRTISARDASNGRVLAPGDRLVGKPAAD